MTEKTTDAVNARLDCFDKVEEFFECTRSGLEFRFAPLVRLLQYPPGIGKTTAVIKVLNDMMTGGFVGGVLIVSERHDLLDRYESELAAPTIHAYGRPSHGLCHFPESAKAMARKHLDMHTIVCNESCSFRSSCAFYALWDARPRIWLATPQMARSARFRNGPPGWEQDGSAWSAIVYDDVKPIQGFTDQIAVTHQDLRRVSRSSSSNSLSAFLNALTDVADEGNKRLAGPSLARALERLVGSIELADLVGGLSSDLEAIDLVASLPTSRVPTAEEINRQPPQFVIKLLEAILHEMSCYFAGVDYNGSIEATDEQVTIGWVERPEYLPHTPTLILDATPDTKAWRWIFGWPVAVNGDQPISFPSNVEIVQVADYFSGKRAMANPGHLAKRLAQVEALMSHASPPVGIITFQLAEEDFKKRFEAQGAIVGHYYSVRGQNQFEDCRTLFVVGRPSPPIGDSLIRAMSPFYAEARPLDTTLSSRPSTYWTPGTTDHMAVMGWFYPDGRIQSTLDTLQDSELLQAVHRIRPLIKKEPVKVFLLTEQPLPTLPIHITGIGGVYCPEFDDRTKAISKAVESALAEEEQEGHDYVTASAVADRLYGSHDRSARRKVTHKEVTYEIAYHSGIDCEVMVVTDDPRNRGGAYKAMVFGRKNGRD